MRQYNPQQMVFSSVAFFSTTANVCSGLSILRTSRASLLQTKFGLLLRIFGRRPRRKISLLAAMVVSGGLTSKVRFKSTGRPHNPYDALTDTNRPFVANIFSSLATNRQYTLSATQAKLVTVRVQRLGLALMVCRAL